MLRKKLEIEAFSGVDLKPVTAKIPQAVFIEADLRSLNLAEVFAAHDFWSLLIWCFLIWLQTPQGFGLQDQARSFELCELALDIAKQFLKPKGHFVCKLFHSDDFQTMKKLILGSFEKFEAVRPESTRKMSKEIFLVGINKKAIA